MRLPYTYAWHRPGGIRAREDAGWSVAYGDLMSLLLCVFVLLVMMSPPPQPRDARFRRVLASLQSVFGTAGPAETSAATAGSLAARLADLTRAERLAIGDPDAPLFRLALDAEGFRVGVSGDRAFVADGAPALTPPAAAGLRQLARTLADLNAGFEVCGYSALPTSDNDVADSQDDRSLTAMAEAYARSRAVADVLVQCGLRINRLQVEGPHRVLDMPGAFGTRPAERGRVDVVFHAPACGHGETRVEGGPE